MNRLWTRRRLLRDGSATAAFAALAARAQMQHAPRDKEIPPDLALDASTLTPFVDPLPRPEMLRPFAQGRYRVPIREVSATLHRNLPETRVWTYGSSAVPPLIEVRRGEPVDVEWQNQLPAQPLISQKGFMVMGAKPVDSPSRTSTHVHGALTSAANDGYPEDWFAPGASRTCHYPNDQQAAMLWFHDHAIGVNRLNIYAGLMGMYVIRDEHEKQMNLPSGRFEIPLMICDRILTKRGQLYYPSPEQTGDMEDEFYGDIMLVNGKIQPYCEVEARMYRLRIVNTAHARTFPLRFSNDIPFTAIGGDQGPLPSTVTTKRFDLAPAERVDVVVDFAHSRGENVVLVGDGFDLVQFRVARAALGKSSDGGGCSSEPCWNADPTLSQSARKNGARGAAASDRTRRLTLDDNDAMEMLLNGKHWHDPVTEIVKHGSTEIWELANLTDDMHPIHLHAVQFHILDRRNISVPEYKDHGRTVFTAPAVEPFAWERGPKDVVQCTARAITRILVTFNNPPGRYVWHCHILEHEANDMMRPYDVVV